MVGWHHQLDGHDSKQAPGVGDGQGGPACCSPWGHKESDTTGQLKNNNDSNILVITLKTKSMREIINNMDSVEF